MSSVSFSHPCVTYAFAIVTFDQLFSSIWLWFGYIDSKKSDSATISSTANESVHWVDFWGRLFQVRMQPSDDRESRSVVAGAKKIFVDTSFTNILSLQGGSILPGVSWKKRNIWNFWVIQLLHRIARYLSRCNEWRHSIAKVSRRAGAEERTCFKSIANRHMLSSKSVYSKRVSHKHENTHSDSKA